MARIKRLVIADEAKSTNAGLIADKLNEVIEVLNELREGKHRKGYWPPPSPPPPSSQSKEE